MRTAVLLVLVLPAVACAQETPPPVQRTAESYLNALSATGDDAGRELLLGGVTLDARLAAVDNWRIVRRDYVKKETGSLKTANALMADLDKAGGPRYAKDLGYLTAEAPGRSQHDSKHKSLRWCQPEFCIDDRPLPLHETGEGSRVEVKAVIEHESIKSRNS